MLGACKLNPVVVNKSPSDWCGQEQQKPIVVKSEAPVVIYEVYDINTDEVKPKRGRKNAGKQE